MSRSKVGQIIACNSFLTAIVEVKRLISHPLYRKRYHVSKRYKAHNPDNKYQVGDSVMITETRPLSKEKHWRIVEKLKTSKKDKS